MSAEKIVNEAKKWINKEYKPGQSAMCADFVSYCLQAAGYDYFTQYVPNMTGWGKRINTVQELQAGDIIIWDFTYDAVSPAGIGAEDTMTHVGLYIGNGDMVHRPTMSKPVQLISILEYSRYGAFNQGRRVWSEVEQARIPELVLSCHSGKIAVEVKNDVTLKAGKVYFPNMAKTVIKFTEKV